MLMRHLLKLKLRPDSDQAKLFIKKELEISVREISKYKRKEESAPLMDMV